MDLRFPSQGPMYFIVKVIRKIQKVEVWIQLGYNILWKFGEFPGTFKNWTQIKGMAQ